MLFVCFDVAKEQNFDFIFMYCIFFYLFVYKKRSLGCCADDAACVGSCFLIIKTVIFRKEILVFRILQFIIKTCILRATAAATAKIIVL